MDQATAKELVQVGAAFHLPGPFFSYEEISRGNVNHTYKANYISDDGSGMAAIKSYLFQKVNTFAFRNPVQLMENIDKVTEFIHKQKPHETCLHYHHTDVTGVRTTYLMEDGSFWRVCNYVPSVTFDTCDDLEVVRNAGQAFGDFQTMLSEFDAGQLFYTIPDFHNTRKRYQTLKQDAAKDPCGRVAEVQEDLSYLLSAEDRACILTDLQNAGQLPLRVTHNDTKINNVLFDEQTRKAIVVIDLDTVMPGLVGHDFGDAIRFAANTTEEDCEDLERVHLDLNVFWAFSDGFLSKTAKTLQPLEIETLAQSCYVLACELATRFLDDYILGDQYFKVHKPKHNLIRTRCQIALAKDMLRKMEAMNGIVMELAKKYRA